MGNDGLDRFYESAVDVIPSYEFKKIIELLGLSIAVLRSFRAHRLEIKKEVP